MKAQGYFFAVLFLFGALLAPLAYAAFTVPTQSAEVGLLRRGQQAEKILPIHGKKVMVLFREGTPRERAMEIYLDPPERRHVVFPEHGRKDREKRKKDFSKRGAVDFTRLGQFFFRGRRQRFQDLNLLSQNYAVTRTQGASIAGRTTIALTIRPHQEGRPSYQVWLDQKTHYPLQTRVLHADQKVVFQSGFEEIDFTPEFPEGIFDQEKKSPWLAMREKMGFQREQTSLKKASRKVSFPVWVPEKLPIGTQASSCNRIRVGTGKTRHDVLLNTYTDGAAQLILIQTSENNPFWTTAKAHLEQQGVWKESSRLPRVYKISQRYGTLFVFEREGTVLAVTGNFAEAELLDMVRNIRRMR